MLQYAELRQSNCKSLTASLAGDGEAIAQGGVVVLLASALGNGASYAFGIFVARMLGPEEFGLYALGLTVFNTLTLIMVLGLDTGMLRFIPQDLLDEGGHRVKSTILTAMFIAASAGIFAGAGLAYASQMIAALYQNPELATVLRLFAVGIPFVTLTTVMIAALQAFQTIRHTIYIKYVWEPAGKFLFAGCLLWAGYQLQGVVIGVVASLIGSTVFALRAIVAKARLSIPDLFTLHPQGIRRLFAFSFPLAVGNLLGTLAPRSDIMMIGYWVSAKEVGVYLAAFQTAAILILVAAAFDFAVAPLLSQAWARNDQTRLMQGYQSVIRLSLTFTTPLFLILVLFSGDILNLFGGEFRTGGFILVILACGQVFNSATTSANTVLLMSGNSRVVMMNTLIFGLGLIGSAAVLIPIWGIAGAAVAAATSSVLMNIARVWEVWHFHRIHPFTSGLFKPLLAGWVVAIIVYFAYGQIEAGYLIGLGLTAIAIYFTVLLILGIEQADKAALSALYRRIRA